MDLKVLLRVLDHPQAVQVIQRKLCSTKATTVTRQLHQTGNDDILVHYHSPVEACSHCKHMLNVLSSGQFLLGTTPSPASETRPHWTVHSLQALTQALASSSSSSSEMAPLYFISTTALHNLLVLLEQNAETMQKDVLEQFVACTEQMLLAANDDWSSFLIGRLKKRMGICIPPLIQFQDSPQYGRQQFSQRVTTVTTVNEVAIESDSSLHEEQMVEGETCKEVASVESQQAELMEGVATSGGVEIQDRQDDNNTDVRLSQPSSQEQVPPSLASSTPVGEEEQKFKKEHAKQFALVNRIIQEWISSKPADQNDFEELCALSNADMSEALEQLCGCDLQETAVIAIRKNISGLKSPMSYHNSSYLIHAALLPMVSGLRRSASRELVSFVGYINHSYSDSLTHALLLPLLKHRPFTAVHSDLLERVFKDSATTKEQLETVCSHLLDYQEEASEVSYCWSDEVIMVPVMLALLQKKISLTAASLNKLIGLLQRNAKNSSEDPKFAKLIIELCKSQQHKMASSI